MKLSDGNKAKLILLGEDDTPIGSPFNVHFNPTEYSKSWELTWQEVGQTLQWTKTAAAEFAVTLQFDTYEAGEDVSKATSQIRSLLDPSSANGPKGCLFQWGKVVYKGVVKNLKENYTLFLADGTPVRSELTLTLLPWPGDLQNRGG